MQRSALRRSRRELSNEYLLAKIGVDTAENEPLKVWGKIHFIIHSPPQGLRGALQPLRRLGDSEHVALRDAVSAKTAGIRLEFCFHFLDGSVFPVA